MHIEDDSSRINKYNYYSLLCGYVGMCMFLYGFFLVNFSSVEHSETCNEANEENNSLRIRPPKTDKIVIMVIDALRYDFLVDDDIVKNMPFTRTLISGNNTCVFPCRVQLPTVTMPRIKALTMGMIPNFFDIVLNFGSTRLFQDNILKQMFKAGKKIVFYGDDTWIKLFPDLFYRYEGTTSFFVTDFVEVDYNVTKNVDKEITHNDWDVMILHYLGLDHIGHLEGPKSLKIPSKLQEMDAVINKLIHYLSNWKKKMNQNYIMIICGDHGMKDTGGHGGSTLSEIMVPFVTSGVSCSVEGEISQVDIAVTLSTLLHIPIPSENVGKIIPGLLHDFSLREKIEAFNINAKQLLKKYVKISDESLMFEIEEQFDKAMHFYIRGKLNEASIIYKSLLNYLSSKLIYSLTEFDVICLYPAILLVVQAIFIPFALVKSSYSLIKYSVFQSTIIICSMYEICHYLSCDSVLCNFKSSVIIVPFLTSFIISFNTILLLNSREIILQKIQVTLSYLKEDSILAFLIFGSMLQICSTISTSFIEEEHMVWYFLWSSFLTIMFLKQYSKRKTIMVYLKSLVSHRVMRKLNQTGDHWASLPDINDWFKIPSRLPYLSFYTIFGLSWIFYSLNYFYGLKQNRNNKKFITYQSLELLIKYLDAFCLIIIYIYRAAVKDVLFFQNKENILSHRGISEFYIYLNTLVISFILKIIRIRIQGNTSKYYLLIVEALISSWMVLSCLLLRTYNIILISILAMNSNWLIEILQNESNKNTKLIILHHWLAHIYFFYQGNSNSLASIDVAAGYIGQKSYNPFFAGILIISSTYAMPVLAYLCMFRNYLKNENKNRETIIKKYSLSRITKCKPMNILLFVNNFYILFYMIVITIHRNHLFIWSVFSPKLLYLASYCILLYPVIIMLQNCY